MTIGALQLSSVCSAVYPLRYLTNQDLCNLTPDQAEFDLHYSGLHSLFHID
jgi:hypothetical protein